MTMKTLLKVDRFGNIWKHNGTALAPLFTAAKYEKGYRVMGLVDQTESMLFGHDYDNPEDRVRIPKGVLGTIIDTRHTICYVMFDNGEDFWVRKDEVQPLPLQP